MSVIASSPELINGDNKDFCGLQGARTLPPGYQARIGYLRTFEIPEKITGSDFDRKLGARIVEALTQDGIFQISIPSENPVLRNAFKASRNFFENATADQKSKLVDSQSFSGYIASGEELTDGVADYSEIFTVTKDLPQTDGRVKQKWPCHGPTPWPNHEFKDAVKNLMDQMGGHGDKLLKLITFGLGLEQDNQLNDLVDDGWHHMRVLHFPPTSNTNGKGKDGRGIGSHTDYGLLVIAAQDDVGGLFIRPPIKGESTSNWETSAAGANEDDDKWIYVPPQPNVFTVFSGDMLQYCTSSVLPSTPHKVALNTNDRYAFAYFHEPNFSANIKKLEGYRSEKDEKEDKGVLYGRHFTNMFMRNYPERITAKRIKKENRMALLDKIGQTPFPFQNRDEARL